MPFDIGFNCRATSGYVTDPSYAVPMLGESYPHTYTNADGKSINAGWVGSHDGHYNRNAANDPRIAGIGIKTNGTPIAFTVDLSSGSAPGAGTYTVDAAFGDANNPARQSFTIDDNTSVLVNGTNGGTYFQTTFDEYRDATVTSRTATTTWNGVTTNLAFATTTVKVRIGVTSAATHYTTFNHFRLTLVEAVAAASLLFAPNRYAPMLVR